MFFKNDVGSEVRVSSKPIPTNTLKNQYAFKKLTISKSMVMSFFVMPSYMHRSGPDNRDLIDGDYTSIVELQ